MIPYRVNADYEFELFHQKQASALINQTIEFLLFFLSDRPLWSQKKYSSEYLSYVKEITGRMPVVVNKGGGENYWGPLKDIKTERWWNSKLTSTELIIQNHWCVKTHILKDESDIQKLNWDEDLLLKDPFGMSGQKFQILSPEKSINERKQIILRSLAHGPQIIEPYLRRRYDFSQYIFEDNRKISYQNYVDRNFQYKGTILNHSCAPKIEDLAFYSEIKQEQWDDFQKQTHEIISFYKQYPNEYGYSIDSFIYEENNQLKIRAISEINYRRTMGRVAYELSQQYSSQDDWTALILVKTPQTHIPLWKSLPPTEGVIVLSPGDSRFEIIFLHAQTREKGKELVDKINHLFPEAMISVEV